MELFTDETATAEELHSDEADEHTTDASQITVLPYSLRKTQYRPVLRLILWKKDLTTVLLLGLPG